MEAKFTIGEARENQFSSDKGYMCNVYLNLYIYATVYGSTPEQAEQRARKIDNVEVLKEALELCLKHFAEEVQDSSNKSNEKDFNMFYVCSNALNPIK